MRGDHSEPGAMFSYVSPAQRVNPTVNFHGEKRSNDTHQSTTDPDARLATKGNGQEAKLFFMGHVVMENRNGLAVGARQPS